MFRRFFGFPDFMHLPDQYFNSEIANNQNKCQNLRFFVNSSILRAFPVLKMLKFMVSETKKYVYQFYCQNYTYNFLRRPFFYYGA